MLGRRQVALVVGIGIAFWLADAIWIRLAPLFVVDPLWGSVAFLFSIPVAWFCVRLGGRLAALAGTQIVSGITLLVIVAALLHAAALRWVPDLYGGDHAGRLGSAWLLWIYGLILGFALLAARDAQPARPASTATIRGDLGRSASG